jgi:hypothetical protein
MARFRKDATRKRLLKFSRQLEKLARQVWEEENSLTQVAKATGDPEAAAWSADLGCICVDHLHPAAEALLKAARPVRLSEVDSEP